MYITRYTDYSLRVLIYLASINASDKLPTIQDVASAYQISKNHLMKIVQYLNNQGYVLATRGKNGGLSLNKPPEQINIGQLVREMESSQDLVECFGQSNQCVITPSCVLKNMLSESLECFYKNLEQYTLQDLIHKELKPELNQILIKSI